MGRTILMGVAALAGIFALILVIWAFRYHTAEIAGVTDAKVQQQSGGNRVFQYERFYNICARVQSAEAVIDSQKALAANMKDGDERLGNIMVTIGGAEAGRAKAITEYNAASAQVQTAGQFKANNLPHRLSLAAYNGTNKTHCAG